MTNTHIVIPSGAELQRSLESNSGRGQAFKSRGETEEQFHGILRLRFASLRMTIDHPVFAA